MLTKKKRSRAVKTKQEVFKGSRLNYNVSQQQRYVAALEKLIDQMSAETERKIERLFKSETAKEFLSVAMDENIASQARILMNALNRKFDDLFGRNAKVLAERMVKSAGKVSKTVLNNSIKKMTGGMSIKTSMITPDLKTILNASVTENVGLIKTIPATYFSRVQGSVMRSIINGNGLESLVPALQKYKGISYRHAKNMALDQTRKVYNSFNASRMEAVGIKKFEWLHSGGSKEPRESHIKISGKIFSFDKLEQEQDKLGVPPEDQGLPGVAINCKCTMTPVYEFTEK